MRLDLYSVGDNEPQESFERGGGKGGMVVTLVAV